MNFESEQQILHQCLIAFQISRKRGCREGVAGKLPRIQTESGEMCPEVARGASLKSHTHHTPQEKPNSGNPLKQNDQEIFIKKTPAPMIQGLFLLVL